MKDTGVYKQMAKYYDFIYNSRGKDYRREADFVDRVISKHGNKGKLLLDVGCGTGEHLLYLRGKYKSAGIDLNKDMLRLAAKKLGKLELRQGDMRSFSFGRKVDAIVCMFSAINYNKTKQDYVRTFRNFSRHLNKGGLVIGDLFSKDMFDPKGRFGYDMFEKGDMHVGRMFCTKLEGNTGLFYFTHIVKDGKKVLMDSGMDKMGILPLEELKLIAMKEGLMPLVLDASNNLFGRSFMVFRKE